LIVRAIAKRVVARAPKKGKRSTRVDAQRREVMRKALLKAIPRTRAGVRFMDLFDTIGRHLPRAGLPGIGSLLRTLTAVKLDLEAKGLIERVPDSVPQRLRRTGRARRGVEK
jgi:hypothetical protein